MKKIFSILIIIFALFFFGCSGSENIDLSKSCPEGQVFQDGACIVPNPNDGCPDGQTLVDGVCKDNSTTCPDGQELVDGVCKTKDEIKCAEDEEFIDGECVTKKDNKLSRYGETQKLLTCSNSEVFIDGKCISCICEGGKYWDGNSCVPIICEEGYTLEKHICIPNNCLITGVISEPTIGCTNYSVLLCSKCSDGYQLIDSACVKNTLSPATSAAGAMVETITIEDKNLEKRIREQLEGLGVLKTGAPITKQSAKWLRLLDAPSSNITSLNGLENFTNLEVLRLKENKIVDLWPLNTLSKLRILDLEENKLESLEFFNEDRWSNLQWLNLSHNNIKYGNDYVNSVINAPNLIYLDLSWTPAGKYDFRLMLNQLQKLEVLKLSNVGLVLSLGMQQWNSLPIKVIQTLKTLELAGNHIEDLVLFAVAEPSMIIGNIPIYPPHLTSLNLSGNNLVTNDANFTILNLIFEEQLPAGRWIDLTNIGQPSILQRRILKTIRDRGVEIRGIDLDTITGVTVRIHTHPFQYRFREMPNTCTPVISFCKDSNMINCTDKIPLLIMTGTIDSDIDYISKLTIPDITEDHKYFRLEYPPSMNECKSIFLIGGIEVTYHGQINSIYAVKPEHTYYNPCVHKLLMSIKYGNCPAGHVGSCDATGRYSNRLDFGPNDTALCTVVHTVYAEWNCDAIGCHTAGAGTDDDVFLVLRKGDSNFNSYALPDSFELLTPHFHSSTQTFITISLDWEWDDSVYNDFESLYRNGTSYGDYSFDSDPFSYPPVVYLLKNPGGDDWWLEKYAVKIFHPATLWNSLSEIFYSAEDNNNQWLTNERKTTTPITIPERSTNNVDNLKLLPDDYFGYQR